MSDQKITGRLMKRNNVWYLAINLRVEDGTYKTKRISTGLPVKGNKARAEEMLEEEIQKYANNIIEEKRVSELTPFAEYLLHWLSTKTKIKESTYATYERNVKVVMHPYFTEKGTYLEEITEEDIAEFYRYLKEERNVSANTVDRYHATIHSALKLAIKERKITINVSEFVEREKVIPATVDYYTASMLKKLLNIVHDTEFEIFVLMGAVYGLRRGEILGLRWNSVHFDENIIMIEHTVVGVHRAGVKGYTVKQDSCKTSKSTRALPMDEFIKEFLLKIKAKQESQKKICGNSYYYGDEEYVCVDSMGYLYRPDYITHKFSKILKKNDLPHIKFHALRHSCASAMLAREVPLKTVQEFLGHSDYGTTDKYYGHLELSSKKDALSALAESLKV